MSYITDYTVFIENAEGIIVFMKNKEKFENKLIISLSLTKMEFSNDMKSWNLPSIFGNDFISFIPIKLQSGYKYDTNTRKQFPVNEYFYNKFSRTSIVKMIGNCKHNLSCISKSTQCKGGPGFAPGHICTKSKYMYIYNNYK